MIPEGLSSAYLRAIYRVFAPSADYAARCRGGLVVFPLRLRLRLPELADPRTTNSGGSGGFLKTNAAHKM